MNLIEEKTRLQRQLDAITMLEGLDADQLSAIKEVLNTVPSKPKDMVECGICGEYFKPSGLKRHQTIAH